MNTLIYQAVIALKTGDTGQAQTFLAQATQLDPLDHMAWLWLAAISADDSKRRIYLERALTLYSPHDTYHVDPEAVITLLNSWVEEGDEQEQRETLAALQQAMPEDFPELVLTPVQP